MTPEDTSMPLLKTCQTCFHAKIRCDKTQDSGLCDRCLRLNKTCVFAPARRRQAGRNARSQRRDGRGPSRSPSSQPSKPFSPFKEGLDTPLTTMMARTGFDEKAAFNPFSLGFLTYERGQDLLDNFRQKLTPHFPFVVVPDATKIRDMSIEKPVLCLAVLAASSFGEIDLQKQLGSLFNQMVAFKMISGNFESIELLQALLVNVAWVHFQPQPRRGSQHLLLATSIIRDMRLDRSRKFNLWMVDDHHAGSDEDWGPDEKRALAGTFYLSSGTSLLLQKHRNFRYNPYVFECCQDLAARAESPTDKHLPYIIHLQKLTEDLEDAVTKSTNTTETHHLTVDLHTIRERYTFTKSSLPFPLSESPTIMLQLNVLDLLISQSSPNGTLFGLNKFQNIEGSTEDQSRIIDWLSQSISAVKSLISVVLVLPQGEEGAMPNMGWVMMYCGLSLAVRLDLVATHPSISQATQHLRRILDMAHCLRQVVLRLEAATSTEPDLDGDRDPFFHLLRRARRIEEWYLERSAAMQGPASAPIFGPASAGGSTASSQPDTALLTPGFSDPASIPSLQVTTDAAWNSSFVADLGTEIDLGNSLFPEPFPFFGDQQF